MVLKLYVHRLYKGSSDMGVYTNMIYHRDSYEEDKCDCM